MRATFARRLHFISVFCAVVSFCSGPKIRSTTYYLLLLYRPTLHTLNSARVNLDSHIDRTDISVPAPLSVVHSRMAQRNSPHLSSHSNLQNGSAPSSPSMSNAQQAGSYPSPSLSNPNPNYQYPPPNNQQSEPYRASPTGSNISGNNMSLPSMRTLDTAQAPMNPAMNQPYYGGQLPHPSHYANVTSDPNQMRYALPATDSRVMSGGRHKKVRRRNRDGSEKFGFADIRSRRRSSGGPRLVV